MNRAISSTISINSDVHCMDYRAIKSSKNGKVVLKNCLFRLHKNKKLYRQNFLLNLNCLDNLSREIV